MPTSSATSCEADRERDALVVRGAGGAVAAWGLILRRRTRWADVHPTTAASASAGPWWTGRCTAPGSWVPTGSARRSRTAAPTPSRCSGPPGPSPVRTAWILRLDHETAAAADRRTVPGIVLRESTPADEVEALEMMELAFSEWPDRPPSTLATWQAMVTRREGFTADQLQLAVTGRRPDRRVPRS